MVPVVAGVVDARYRFTLPDEGAMVFCVLGSLTGVSVEGNTQAQTVLVASLHFSALTHAIVPGSNFSVGPANGGTCSIGPTVLYTTAGAEIGASSVLIVGEDGGAAIANLSSAASRCQITYHVPTLCSVLEEGSGYGLTVQYATPSDVYSSIDPTSMTVNFSTPIQLMGTTNGHAVAFAFDCSLVDIFLFPTEGTDSITEFNLTDIGTYYMCVRASGGSDSTQQNGISMTVIQSTSPNNIWDVAPRSLSVSTLTPLVLYSRAVESVSFDIVLSSSGCTSATFSPPLGSISNTQTNVVGSFSFGHAGFYSVCTRANGGSDSVAQTNISVSVINGTSNRSVISTFPSYARVGETTSVVLVTSSLSVSGVGSFAGECVLGMAMSTTIVNGSTLLTSATSIPQHLKLCFSDDGGSDAVEQEGVSLVVNPWIGETIFSLSTPLVGSVNVNATFEFTVPSDLQTSVDGVTICFPPAFTLTKENLSVNKGFEIVNVYSNRVKCRVIGDSHTVGLIGGSAGAPATILAFASLADAIPPGRTLVVSGAS
eukprot:Stramenopile-MAST_4_protein_4956